VSLDETALARLAAERWFGAKERRPVAAAVLDTLLGGGGALTVAEVSYEEGEAELYTLLEPEEGGFWSALMGGLAGRSGHGRFRLEAFPALGALDELADRPLGKDQSNSSFVLGERLVIKCYRRIWPGPHPEVELAAYLGSQRRFRHVPETAGSLHWGDPPHALVLLQTFVPEAEDGWVWAGELLRRSLDGAPLAETTPWAGVLGAITAELHDVLAEGFGVRQAEGRDLRAWSQRALALLDGVERTAGAPLEELSGAVRDELAAFESPTELPLLTRIHGDLHVGQVLRSPAGYHVIDFEGEPTRPPEERRALDSPLRDVASMIRSFDNLARWQLREAAGAGNPLAVRSWVAEVRGRFLDAYAARRAVDETLLRALEVEKAVYELAYAFAFLPEWAEVAQPALQHLVGRWA
jgi:maltokinase